MNLMINVVNETVHQGVSHCITIDQSGGLIQHLFILLQLEKVTHVCLMHIGQTQVEFITRLQAVDCGIRQYTNLLASVQLQAHTSGPHFTKRSYLLAILSNFSIILGHLTHAKYWYKQHEI